MTVVQLAATETHMREGLALTPLGIGLVTGGILVAVLVLTYAFRNVGNRH